MNFLMFVVTNKKESPEAVMDQLMSPGPSADCTCVGFLASLDIQSRCVAPSTLWEAKKMARGRNYPQMARDLNHPLSKTTNRDCMTCTGLGIFNLSPSYDYYVAGGIWSMHFPKTQMRIDKMLPHIMRIKIHPNGIAFMDSGLLKLFRIGDLRRAIRVLKKFPRNDNVSVYDTHV